MTHNTIITPTQHAMNCVAHYKQRLHRIRLENILRRLLSVFNSMINNHNIVFIFLKGHKNLVKMTMFLKKVRFTILFLKKWQKDFSLALFLCDKRKENINTLSIKY